MSQAIAFDTDHYERFVCSSIASGNLIHLLFPGVIRPRISPPLVAFDYRGRPPMLLSFGRPHVVIILVFVFLLALVGNVVNVVTVVVVVIPN